MNPDLGPRCGECRMGLGVHNLCRMGLGVHNLDDPLCEARPPGRHMAPWPRCTTCGKPENEHPYRHPFKPLKLSRRCACGSLTLSTTVSERHDRGLHGADRCPGALTWWRNE